MSLKKGASLQEFSFNLAQMHTARPHVATAGWVVLTLLGSLFASCSSTSKSQLISNGTGGSGSGGEAQGGDDSSGGDGSGSGGDGSGGRASAGEGGAGGDSGCPDGDGDGVTTCDGDCDDDDATSKPGADEICGDLADNDCSAGADDECQGIGTFVSARAGSDDNPGTTLAPLATIAKGLENAELLGGGHTVYVADAVYEEDILLVESVSLAGGYQCDSTSCTWERDAARCLTVIRPSDERGVRADETISNVTRVDGFRIEAAPGAAVGVGRSALTVDGGTPLISGNCIVAAPVTGGTATSGRSLGVNIRAPLNDEAGIILQDNAITGASSAVAASLAVTIEASTAGQTAVVTLRRNRIRGGSGTFVAGVWSLSAAAGSRFDDNDIAGGTATSQVFGVAIRAGSVALDSNHIHADPEAVPSSASTTANYWSGAVQILNASATLTNNLLYGANANGSTGIQLWQTVAGTREVIINSNTIIGGSIAPAAPLHVATCIALGRGCTTGCAANLGRIRNNILRVQGGNIRYPGWESAGDGVYAQQPDALENNVFSLADPGAANQGLYRKEPSPVFTDIAALNAMVTVSGFVGGNLETDPKLNASGHIGLGSLARDAGTDKDVPDHDIDGDARPIGTTYDIGADESP